MSEEIENYLHQLRQRLPIVPPINPAGLKSLHKDRDYIGMVQRIKEAMNIEVGLRVGLVNSGVENKNAPAWIQLPADMPPYGTAAFKNQTITMLVRKSFLAKTKFDQAAITIAHELSHIVLDSINHPLRREEKAVDLTAMLLGFRDLYASGAHKVEHSGDRISTETIGYLTQQEVWAANRILEDKYHAPASPRFRANSKPMFAGALLGVVAAFLGAWWYYDARQVQPQPQAAPHAPLPLQAVPYGSVYQSGVPSPSPKNVEVLGDRVRCDVRFSELHLPDSAYRSFFDRCMGTPAGADKGAPGTYRPQQKPQSTRTR